MAEIGNIWVKLGLDTTEFQNGLKEANKQLGDVTKQAKDSFGNIAAASKQMGTIMMGVGASIMAALGLAAKAASDEEQKMARLDVTLSNVGVNFQAVQGPLNDYIAGLQKLTAVNSGELYSALTQIINMTGDYHRSLKLLPIALDLAAAKNIDLSTAAMLVGKVAQGNTSVLQRYGIILQQGATSTQNLAVLQDKFAGSAEAMGKTTEGSLKQIKNSLNELAEGFGKVLLPVIKGLAEALSGFVDWVNKAPAPVKAVATGLTLLVGVMALLIGAMLVYNSLLISAAVQTTILTVKMAAQTIAAMAATAAQWLWNAAMLANPIGLVVAAVAALIAGIVLLVKWLTRSKDTAGENAGALQTMNTEVKAINSEVEQMVADWADVQTAWFYSQTEAGKLGVTLTDLEKYLLATGQQGKLTTEIFNKLGSDINALAKELGIDLEAVASFSKDTTSEMLADFKDLTSEMEDQARQQTEDKKAALNEQLDAEREAHDERLAAIDEETDSFLAANDARLAAQLGLYQSDLDGVNKQLDDMAKAQQTARDAKRVADLRAAIEAETDPKHLAELRQQLAEEAANQEAAAARQVLENKRDSIRQQMEDARKAAADSAKLILEQAQARKDAENETFAAFSKNITEQETALDAALAVQIGRYDSDLAAFEAALGEKLKDMAAYVAAYNALAAKLNQPAYSVPSGLELSSPPPELPPGSAPYAPMSAGFYFPGYNPALPYFGGLSQVRMFKAGGIVPGAYGQPVMVMAHGGERFEGMNAAARSAGGQGVIIQNYIAGSVIAARDLGQVVREEFFKIMGRNYTSGVA